MAFTGAALYTMVWYLVVRGLGGSPLASGLLVGHGHRRDELRGHRAARLPVAAGRAVLADPRLQRRRADAVVVGSAERRRAAPAVLVHAAARDGDHRGPSRGRHLRPRPRRQRHPPGAVRRLPARRRADVQQLQRRHARALVRRRRDHGPDPRRRPERRSRPGAVVRGARTRRRAGRRRLRPAHRPRHDPALGQRRRVPAGTRGCSTSRCGSR